MDESSEALAMGHRLADEALARERQAESKTRCLPTIPAEAKGLFRKGARVAGLPTKVIYDLVNLGVLSPCLDAETDWFLLSDILPKMGRSSIFARSLLARMTFKERMELIDHADEDVKERFIRRQLEKNPDLQAKELLSALTERYPRAMLDGKTERGVPIRNLCTRLIKKHRDRIKARQRLEERGKILRPAIADYYRRELTKALEHYPLPKRPDRKLQRALEKARNELESGKCRSLARFSKLFADLQIECPRPTDGRTLELDRQLKEIAAGPHPSDAALARKYISLLICMTEQEYQEAKVFCDKWSTTEYCRNRLKNECQQVVSLCKEGDEDIRANAVSILELVDVMTCDPMIEALEKMCNISGGLYVKYCLDEDWEADD